LFRPQFIYSDSSCPSCHTRTGNSNILCTQVAFRVTLPQPSDHQIISS
jgi:hypothetical protein